MNIGAGVGAQWLRPANPRCDQVAAGQTVLSWVEAGSERHNFNLIAGILPVHRAHYFSGTAPEPGQVSYMLQKGHAEHLDPRQCGPAPSGAGASRPVPRQLLQEFKLAPWAQHWPQVPVWGYSANEPPSCGQLKPPMGPLDEAFEP